MAVYRIPIRSVFNRKRSDKTASWKQVYGGKKCLKCKQYFEEGDAYTVVTVWEGKLKLTPVHKYQHVECPPKEKHGIKQETDHVHLRQPELSETGSQVHRECNWRIEEEEEQEQLLF